MNAPPRGSRACQRGLTLVEMMIALVLGLIVVTAAIAVFLSNKQAYTTNDALTQVQDSARVAFELLARDIRQAGLTGCGDQGRVADVLTDGPNNGGTDWYADFANAIHGYDDASDDPALAGLASDAPVAGTGSIQLIGAGSPTVTVQTPGESSFTINEADSTLQSGDAVILCDPDHATIAQLSTYTPGSPPTLAFTKSGSNCSDGLGFPTNCTGSNVYQFPVNAQASRLSATDWYVGTNAQGGTSLYRMTLVNTDGTLATTAQEMVRSVTALQILYHATDSNPNRYVDATTIGADWANVDAVQLKLTLESVMQRAGTDARPLERTLSALVALRNRTP